MKLNRKQAEVKTSLSEMNRSRGMTLFPDTSEEIQVPEKFRQI
jgi:hypothetical protein